VADFTQQLSNLHARHAEELQLLVESFRKRNSELRKERKVRTEMVNYFQNQFVTIEWSSRIRGRCETSDVVSLSLFLKHSTQKLQIKTRKGLWADKRLSLFLSKLENVLVGHGNYAEAYRAVSRRGFSEPVDAGDDAALAAYYDCHNAYVQQLAATNGMMDEYYANTLPRLLDELQEVYCDLSTVVAQSLLAAADLLASKAREQAEHYEAVGSSCRAVNAKTDLAGFVRTLCSDRNTGVPPTPPRHQFLAPRGDDESISSGDSQQTLGEQMVVDRLASLSVVARSESLKQDIAQLETQVRQLQETLDALLRLQQRSLESSLYNKANELQEDISLKRFDLHVAQIHLAAVKAQLIFGDRIQRKLCLQRELSGFDKTSEHFLQEELAITVMRVSSQFSLFRGKEVEAVSEEKNCRDRKATSPAVPGTGTIKNKWLKAFRSLKTGTSTSGASGASDKGKSGNSGGSSSWDTGQHVFQEYTYKKVTACDACREILRGHVRQGLKCKLCKLNVHNECQEKAGRCQPKPRLLRRQRSASEIETKIVHAEPEEESERSSKGAVCQPTRVLTSLGTITGPVTVTATVPDAVDPIYQLLKQAGDLGGSGRRGEKEGSLAPRLSAGGGESSSITSSVASLQQRRPRSNASSSASSSSSHMLTVSSHQHHPSSSARWRQIVSAPHSPQRKKLSLRMKSLSLDSPESNEHAHRRRQLTGGLPHIARCHCAAPQSPVHGRRQLLSTKAVRMSSVDLPDDNEKSLSSASTSPCPSPKPHRLLPTNLYVVLYNFRSRHQDELDLKAGDTVTVIDTTDPDWWQGKCMGRSGFFPSKYVAKLHSGERALQVVHSIQVLDGHEPVKLLRDQIVIQVGDEMEGKVLVRTGLGDKALPCPLKYLQEV
ncbi:unnamed protein product, partial [Ixodes hexagonus]